MLTTGIQYLTGMALRVCNVYISIIISVIRLLRFMRHRENFIMLLTCLTEHYYRKTNSSAVAERPFDISCQ